MQHSHVVFLKIAELGNLTAASRALNVAQPSLTRSIKMLEASVGTKLFVRKNNGMELTTAGAVFEKYLRSMAVTYKRALSDLDAISRGHVDKLRIGCGAAYLLLLMPDIIQGLCKMYPSTLFHVASGSASDLKKSLQSGNLDVVISAQVSPTVDAAIDIINLGHINHGIVHWPGTLPGVLPGDVLSISNLTGREWILFESEPEVSEAIWDIHSREGLPTPVISSTSNSINFSLEMVKRNRAISSLPSILKEELESRGFLFNEVAETIWCKESGISIHSNNKDHPILNSLVRMVAEFIEKRPGLQDREGINFKT